jgi:hypothetical protein
MDKNCFFALEDKKKLMRNQFLFSILYTIFFLNVAVVDTFVVVMTVQWFFFLINITSHWVFKKYMYIPINEKNKATVFLQPDTRIK